MFINYPLKLNGLLKIIHYFEKTLPNHSIKVQIYYLKLQKFSLFIKYLNEILLNKMALNLLFIGYFQE